MTDYYLLHTHNAENEVYKLFDTQEQAFNAMMAYITMWWDKEIPLEPLPDPITRQDADYYFSESGEWANIVRLDIPNMTTDVIAPSKVWKK